MLEVIKGAEAFEGRVLDVEPSLSVMPNTITVCSSIIFSFQSKLDAFRTECQKILSQE